MACCHKAKIPAALSQPIVIFTKLGNTGSNVECPTDFCPCFPARIIVSFATTTLGINEHARFSSMSKAPLSLETCKRTLCAPGLWGDGGRRLHAHGAHGGEKRTRPFTAGLFVLLQSGGRLVTINDAATNAFVTRTLDDLPWSNSGVWIGLHDRDTELRWTWATESDSE